MSPHALSSCHHDARSVAVLAPADGRHVVTAPTFGAAMECDAFMELRQLRWFLAAVDAGSLSGAARKGHISQPALSVMIAQLERELGARLLERGRDGVRPTAAGRAVVGVAHRMVYDADQLSSAARAARDEEPAVRLAITDAGMLPLAASVVAVGLIASIRVHLVIGRNRPWDAQTVRSGEADLAIVTAPVLDRRIRTAPFATESRGILVGPRNDLFAGSHGDLTLAVIAEQAAIDPVDVPEEWTDAWAYRPQMNGQRLRRAGPPVDSMSATFLAAMTSEAVAFVPRQMGMIGEAMGLRYLEPADGPMCEHLLAWQPPISQAAQVILRSATGAIH